MPENTQTATEPTVTDQVAADLRTAANSIQTCGLWTGPAYADPFGTARDPIAALYRAATGRLPYLLALPDLDAIEQGRAMVENNPRAWAAVQRLAEHLDSLHSAPGPIADPVETIAGWIVKRHIPAQLVANEMRTAALLLTAALATDSATAPVADRAA